MTPFSHEVPVNSLYRTARGAVCALALLVSAAACDKDPSGTAPAFLTVALARAGAADTVIGRNEPIRVVFSIPVDQRTALDPENFIVIDRCTGLRVAGSVRLAGDTLIFTPSRALQFLTPLDVRVQNVLGSNGARQEEPFTFSLITQAPPVSDVTWASLNSPTNDAVGGISFADRNVGYISTFGGAVYRTTDGGRNFAALFKDPDIIQTSGIRTVGPDTLFMTAAPSLGGTTFTTSGLFRSIDGGRSFQSLFLRSPADMSSPSVWKRPGGRPVVVIGGNLGELAAWRYDTQNDSIYQFGPISDEIGARAQISPDGANAALAGQTSVPFGQSSNGVLYRSTDGGRSYVKVTALPTTSDALSDVAFSGNTIAFAVGLRSAFYRLDATTGAVTRIGAANGIPQTDSTANLVQTYNFTAIWFVPGSQAGWAVGFIERRQTGSANIRRGLIMQTTDGGASWTRQAVAGAPESGLGFAPLYDVSALATDFATVSGESGFIAARTVSTTQQTSAACSFKDQPVEPVTP